MAAINRIRDLIIKHLKEEIRPDESQELENWIHLSEENFALFNQLTDPDFLEEAMKESHNLRLSILKKIDLRIKEYRQAPPPPDGSSYSSATNLPLAASASTDTSAASPDIFPGTSTDRPPTDFPSADRQSTGLQSLRPARTHLRRKIWPYSYAAAACVLALVTGVYFWQTRSSHPAAVPSPAATAINDVAPGSDKATLTLANGSTIVLENATNGNLAVQGTSRVTKDKNLLAYTAASSTANKSSSSANSSTPAMVYNTLTTPRAGQFQLVLPDGSKVWLNNASSLRYPTSFSAATREVTLSGEAYFEIAKDAHKPFLVKVNNLAVNVLGTSFNIMAYNDDPVVKTTLLTGKVSLAVSGRQALLSPGEQAVLSRDGSWKTLKGVDTDEAIAWQRGYFHFTHEDIEDVLRQLARWYDVEVVFTIPVPDYRFDGEIGRDLSLSSILGHLEKKDLHYRIDGKKLIVSK